ncbi:putative lyase beta subunit [Anaeramoeba ignava]|uniref:Lyase beta subunit n=1 Tax=Anaeramoeba ignava TaxID=1746090 RepID=A0A9Q0LSY1_ANAIG|nr:putative lyase beta subunit [Anaeramoeba ignava]|eukprot:Anaeramoba_ignava/a219437_58.p1 GENE.a219437_58~~a219437_58.p1  ORF type:complete len:393 (+),score=99.09 a219437_58:31-1209(+)
MSKGDCKITINFETEKKEVEIEIKMTEPTSIPKEKIQHITENLLNFYKIKAYEVKIEDSGAPEYAIASRVESLVRKHLKTPSNTPYFEIPTDLNPPKRTPLLNTRRSLLYIPGSKPYMLGKSPTTDADCVIFDLEDSVSFSDKDVARIIVRNALRCLPFQDDKNGKTLERIVRINPLPLGEMDLECLDFKYLHGVVIPKCESEKDVLRVEELISKSGVNQVHLMPLIESALGVENAFNIVNCSKNIVSVSMGLEDYTADMGMERSKTDQESEWAMARVKNAAAAAGIQAIDTVYSNFRDNEGLKQAALKAKAFGYIGKRCIHPAQVPIVNSVFVPTEKEIENAQKIVSAYNEAIQRGDGVVVVNDKMVDLPVVKRANRILSLAKDVGLLEKK